MQIKELIMKKLLWGLAAVLPAIFMTACCSENLSAVSDIISTYEEFEQDSSDSIAGSLEFSSADDSVSTPAEQTEIPNYETAEKSETSVSEAENTASLPDDIDNYENDSTASIDEHGTYTTKEDVALYIHTYNKLPENFITKKEAEALGWPGGELEKYAPGKCIGGSYFGNYEKLLPEKKGREYHECDIDTLGAKSRGAKRIVFSNDGLIYYTEDHYESFELLYGEE